MTFVVVNQSTDEYVKQKYGDSDFGTDFESLDNACHFAMIASVEAAGDTIAVCRKESNGDETPVRSYCSEPEE